MEVKNIRDVPAFDDVCGKIRETYRSPDGRFTLAHATITGVAASHLHRRMEEVYYVISGTGRMHIEQEQKDVGPCDTVAIPPGSYHRIEKTSQEPLEVIVIASPNFNPSDLIEEK